MNNETERRMQELIDRPTDMGTTDLFKALEQTGIHCFRYYPKSKLIVVPENTQKAWNCKPYYENMPYSLSEEFVDEAYRNSFNRLYFRIDDGEPSSSLVFCFKDKKTWSRVTLTATKWDEQQKPEECIAIVENISAIKNNEKSITERNRSLSLVMQVFQIAAETTGTIVFLFDTKRQSIMVTDNTANQWGVMTEQMGVPYETAASGIVSEDTKAEYIRIHEEMMNGAARSSGRVSLRDADGNTGHYELTLQALFDEDGVPTGKAAGIYKNITDSVRHDHKQEFIIKSLGNTYSSIYYVDMTTRKYERIAERETASLAIPGTGDWDDGLDAYINHFVDEPYRENMFRLMKLEDLEERLKNAESRSCEYQRIDKGWRKAFMVPAERDCNGRMSSAIFAVQKIDAEKLKELETQKALKQAYEAAQFASSAKTTFLSNMSHDIRTPMNAIIGMTAIAAAHLDNAEKVADCLKKITTSSKHLLGLINEVLDMSKIESGKVDLVEENFSLPDLVDELISIHHPLIKAKGHTLNVKSEDIVHENVIGDSTRLKQVFSNLLSNAIKYTPAGGTIEFVISEKETDKNTVGWYTVEVRDNGIGMSEEFRRTIFDPFSRADDTRITAIQGTGLGMSIARNIIRMMNGDITVKSELNKGSEFSVSFVLKLRSEAKVDYSRFVDLPVLVADDDPTACESTCLILDGLSMKSEWVTSGREAVERAVRNHEEGRDYYAIIVDWKMPDMDGVATAKELRRKIGHHVPIIVLTAYDWSDIEQEARAAGISAFLSKPLFKTRIVDLFADFLRISDKPDEKADILKKNDFSGKRILLAEDNELNSEIAVEILSMMGLEVDTAENGRICLEKFTDSSPGLYDLILMDIQMPIMNGYESAASIRASEHPCAQSIPIIAMTANAFSSDVRKAFDSGMNGHISKPIDIDKMIEVLEENLKK